jgi:hypothetical protein
VTTSLALLRTHVALDLPESLTKRIHELYPDQRTPIEGPPCARLVVQPHPEGFRLSGPDGFDELAPNEATALSQLLARINIAVLAATPMFAVHAGVVSAGSRVIALPAVSGTGKSTLVAACLRAGLTYVSDEALCLQWTDGAIVPYARPLALSPDSCRLLGIPVPPAGEQLLTVADLGAEYASEPLRLKHVVLLDHTADQLRPGARGDGAAALLGRSFNHWRRPGRAFELAHELVRGASVWHLGRGTPATAAAQLVGLLSA